MQSSRLLLTGNNLCTTSISGNKHEGLNPPRYGAKPLLPPPKLFVWTKQEGFGVDVQLENMSHSFSSFMSLMLMWKDEERTSV